MTKAIFNSTWVRCWKIIRIIPFIADSGAFVTGVWVVLRHFEMNWQIGIAVVVFGLVGIAALVSRFERSKSLNQIGDEPLIPQSDNVTKFSARRGSNTPSRGQGFGISANQQRSPIASDQSLKFKAAMGKLRIEIISTRTAVRDSHRRKMLRKKVRSRTCP